MNTSWRKLVVRVFGPGSQEGQWVFLGTAFLISDTLALTALHVVGDQPSRAVLRGPPWGGDRQIERVVQLACDVALLQIPPGADFPSSSPRFDQSRVALQDAMRVLGFDTYDRDLMERELNVISHDGKADAYVLSSFIGQGVSGGPVYRGDKIVGVVHARNKDLNNMYITPFRAFADQLRRYVDIDEHAPAGGFIKSVPDASPTVGRGAELNDLEVMVLGGRKKIIELVGEPGIGKSTLASMLRRRCFAKFESAGWFSLEHRPPLGALLPSIIKVVSGNAMLEPEDGNVERLLTKLAHLIRQRRCLLVLDNFESILDSNAPGTFADIYKNYSQLLHALANRDSRSVAILTSRDRTSFVDDQQFAASYPVRGLREEDCFQLLARTHDPSADREAWSKVFQQYAKNPQMVLMAIPHIQEVWGDPVSFLADKDNKLIVGDMELLLSEVIARVTEPEQDVLFWLAVSREPMSLRELRTDVFDVKSRGALQDSVKRLQTRHLIERTTDKRYYLQPVVSEYVTEQLMQKINREISEDDEGAIEEFVDRVEAELATGRIRILHRYALLRATSRDYIQAAQRRALLEPLGRRLQERYGSLAGVRERFKTLLQRLRRSPGRPSYAAGNIINLLSLLSENTNPAAFEGLSFQGLPIWQADFRRVTVRGADFSNCRFGGSVFRQQMGSVTSVAFCSVEGDDAVAAGDMTSLIHVWRLSDGQRMASLKGHRAWIMALAWNGKRRQLASGGDDGELLLWDLLSEKPIARLTGHTARIRGLAFTPSQRTLLSVSEDSTLRIWDLTDNSLKTIQHPAEPLSVAVAPTGAYVATGASDGFVRIWNYLDGRLVCERKTHDGQVWALAWKGARLASGGEDRRIVVMEPSAPPDHLAAKVELRGHDAWVCALALTEDGNRLFSSSEDRQVIEWDVAEKHRLDGIRDHDARVRAIALDSKGKYLASGSFDQSVRIWDVGKKERTHIFNGSTNWVWGVYWINDRFFASVSQDGHLWLWRSDSDTPIRSLHRHHGWALGMTMASGTSKLVTGGRDGRLMAYDLLGKSSRELDYRHESWVWAVAASEDGARIAAASEDCSLSLSALDSGRLLALFHGHTDRVRAVRFVGPDKLVSCSYDRSVRIWDIPTNTEEWRHEHHGDWVLSLDVLEGAIASSDASGMLAVARPKSADVVRWKGHEGRVWVVKWLSSGVLLTASEDGAAKIWRLSDLTSPIAEYRGESGLLSAALSRNGMSALLGTDSDAILAWDLRSAVHGARYAIPRCYERTSFREAEGLEPSQLETIKSMGGIIR